MGYAIRTRAVVLAAAIGLAAGDPPVVEARPANDDLANATVIGTPYFHDEGDTTEATVEPDEPQCASLPEASVWYRVDVETASEMQIVVHTDFGAGIAVFEQRGLTPGHLKLRDCADAGLGRPGRVFLGAGPNRLHFVQIAGYGSSRGSYMIDVVTLDTIGPPVNDSIENAIEIERLPFADTRDVRDATWNPGEPYSTLCSISEEFDYTVWYRYRPDRDQRLTFSTLGSDYGTLLFVYDDDGLRDHLPLACQAAPEGRSLPLTVDVEAGETYWVQVGSGDEEEAGRLFLTVLGD